MGGLGNGRRVGRSPPLLIGALIACILVLGFNYWVSSSRNLELQTKLYELEGQVRRGAAERGVAEMKKTEYEEEIQRQKEQIVHIESLYKRQLEAVESTCNQDKVNTVTTLQQNITSSTKITQELKGQLNQLNDEVGKLQRELQACQGKINTLNNKLTYDMTQCHSQVLSQKELCDERVVAAKLEVQKKMEKHMIPNLAVSSQEKAVVDMGKDDVPFVTTADLVVSHAPNVSQPQANEPPELLTNEIIVDPVPKVPTPSLSDITKTEPHSVSTAEEKKDLLPPLEGAVETKETEPDSSKLLKNNLTEEKAEEMDAHKEGALTEGAEPGMEPVLFEGEKVDETPDAEKLQDVEEYDADEQTVGGEDLEKQEKKLEENIDKDMEEELADYNGDDDNEGEFEADKQAELARL